MSSATKPRAKKALIAIGGVTALGLLIGLSSFIASENRPRRRRSPA